MSDWVAVPTQSERPASDAVVQVAEGDLVPLEPLAARPPDVLYHLALLAVSLAVVALAAILTVRDQTQVLIPLTGIPLPELCLAKRWFGLGCPGCGMTRCFISLARGDLAAAWSYNPAGPLLFLVVAAQIPLRTLQLVRIRLGLPELTWGLVPQVMLGAVAVIMISQWLLRLCGFSW